MLKERETVEVAGIRKSDWERAERTSTYVIRFAPLRRNCLNFPPSVSHHTHSRTYRKWWTSVGIKCGRNEKITKHF